MAKSQKTSAKTQKKSIKTGQGSGAYGVICIAIAFALHGLTSVELGGLLRRGAVR